MSQTELLDKVGIDRPMEILELPNGSLRVITLWDLYAFLRGRASDPYPKCQYRVLAKEDSLNYLVK